MRKFLQTLIVLLAWGGTLRAATNDSLFLVTNVAPLSFVGFFADAEGTPQPDDTWTMDDDHLSVSAYLLAKNNTTSVMKLSVNLPVLRGTLAIADQTLAYSTTISKVGNASGVTLENGGPLDNSPDTSTFTPFGAIVGDGGATTGVYQFDFAVDLDDYWSAFAGAYETTVTVTISN